MRWQVKDYADGWITFESLDEAINEVETMGGGLIRPLSDADEEGPIYEWQTSG